MAEQTYSYTYDDNGNIVSTSFWNETFAYVYDSQNQLVRENNSRLGYTYTWTYDNAGNITSRSTYAYTTGELGEATSVIQYRYEDSDWGDLLTSFGSNAITYDEIGNMLTYGTRTFTWEHGRQLASTTKNGVTWTYSYGADGMRTGRTNGTDTYEYIYNGAQLMRMVRNGVTVDFTYIGGIPATISFNGNTFYYIVNGQGDVTGITDSEGNLQISYYYTAWGDPYYIYAAGATYASTLLTLNPLMYRGYVYDREAGMYYLQSRYYVPILGRFLNADGYISTGDGIIGNNMFAYCVNNPINRSDFDGRNSGVLDWWLTFGLTLPALDGFFPVGEVAYAVGIVITGAIVLCQSGSSVKEEAITEAATVKATTQSGNYSVYFLCSAGDPSREIIYVGRVKTANFDSRMSYHSSRCRELVDRIDNLTYEACRGIEQAGMTYYHTINRGNKAYNQIRGISPFNKQKGVYLSAAFNFARSDSYMGNSILPQSYWDNFAENELLNGLM